MLFRPSIEDRLERLQRQVRQAVAVTPALMADVIAEGCTRLPLLESSDAARRIDRLIALKAWTEAALAIAELELPQTKMRRLVYEDGEWCCSLSRELRLPDWLDDSVEARHDVLPLAILLALVEALRLNSAPKAKAVRTVPQHRLAQDNIFGTVGCDNFG